jgi:RNA polymerase sigma-70 factor (ECF subfamily)
MSESPSKRPPAPTGDTSLAVPAGVLAREAAPHAGATASRHGMQERGLPPAPVADPDALRLADAIARGDRRAEDRFVRRYGPGLTAILRVRCGDPELCKDLAQEALQVALLRLRAGKVEQPEALAGFLRGTALNLLANELRRSERRLADASSDWMDELQGDGDDPAAQVENDDLVRSMRETIGGLKVARDRELLWRYYVEQAPKEALCASLALSSEHFDRVLHRARLRLRELWLARHPAGGAAA